MEGVCGIMETALRARRGGERMKKIPTLFRRVYDDGSPYLTREVTKGCEWVGDGEGVATEKVDGAACAIIDGVFYRRYDAKRGKEPPSEGIPCQDAPDPVTGHWPWWVPVREGVAADRWYFTAHLNTPWCREDGTYEAVGPHFQRNPYDLPEDVLERHGRIKLPDCPRDWVGIREYLRAHEIEGIVWHRGNGDMCKIKRTDYGFPWPVERGSE